MVLLVLSSLFLSVLGAPPSRAQPSSFRSDAFTGVLNESLWSIVDPLGDATIAVRDGRLEIAVPGGRSHDDGGANEMPRVLQQGADEDFELEAKFDSVPSQRFQMQGLIIEENPQRYVRLELRQEAQWLRAQATSVIDGRSTQHLNERVEGQPGYLRAARSGDIWTLSHSSDGDAWITVGSFSQSLTVTTGGVFAGNHGNPPRNTPAFTAEVDYFLNTADPLEEGPEPPPPPEPPVLSGLTVGGITSDSAVVGWSTDVPASSHVEYGPTDAYGFERGSDQHVTEHVVDLSNLDCETTYHYRVRSTNVDGETATSGDATFITGGCPEPEPRPPEITDVAVSDVASHSATVSWDTDVAASSWVEYGDSESYGSQAGSDDHVIHHRVVLDELACGAAYHFRVVSTGAGGLTATSEDATFVTDGCPEPDPEPPEPDPDPPEPDPDPEPPPEPAGPFVSDGFVGGLDPSLWSVVDPLGDASVAVVDGRLRIGVPGGRSHNPWVVNEAPRVMQAGADEDFELEVKFDSAPAQRWQMQGVVVEESPQRYVRLEFHHDGSGLRVYGARVWDGTASARFNREIAVTEGPLWLRVVREGDSWTQRYSYDGQSWQTGGSFSQPLVVTGGGVFAGNHGSPVSATPAFTAVVDYFHSTSDSPDPDPPDPQGPVITDVEVSGVTGAAATVSWSTDVAASSGVEYGLTDGYGSQAGTQGLVTAHRVELAGLECGAAYHFRVVSTGAGGLTATSEDATFVTDGCPDPDPEPPEPDPPGQAPVISDVAVTHTTGQSATISWTTQVAASARVDYGVTAHYGAVAEGGAGHVTSHQVVVDWLTCQRSYQFRVTSANEYGDDAITGTFEAGPCTTPGLGEPPAIDLWHGPDQSFGQPGSPQRWINLLGNASSAHGVSSLTYSLNGGVPVPLSLGPTNRRLSAPGDFNVEIAEEDLATGTNIVTLTAMDTDGRTTTEAVVVNLHTSSEPMALPFETEWAGAAQTTDFGQAVDGRWVIRDGELRLEALDYDRLFTLGDMRWQDFEVTVPVTVHRLGPNARTPQSGHPMVGLAVRWSGHTRLDAEQPSQYWYPTGAFAWYRWGQDRLELVGNDGSPFDRRRMPLEFGEPYLFKVRAQTIDAGSRYQFKVWHEEGAEPSNWQMSIVDDGPSSGAIGLLAHHADARFGDVVVTPLP